MTKGIKKVKENNPYAITVVMQLAKKFTAKGMLENVYKNMNRVFVEHLSLSI